MSSAILTNPLTGEEISNEQMSELSKQIEQQLKMEADIAHVEAGLARMHELHEKLITQTIPSLMEELGISEFTLSSGIKVKIKDIIVASIPKGGDDFETANNQRAAMDWLTENEHGDIIKSDVICSFTKGQRKEVLRAVAALVKAKVPHVQRDSVHYQTLCALYRELLSAGKTLPENLFNTYVGKKSTIKAVKGK
jgi:hypothetical protein